MSGAHPRRMQTARGSPGIHEETKALRHEEHINGFVHFAASYLRAGVSPAGSTASSTCSFSEKECAMSGAHPVG